MMSYKAKKNFLLSSIFLIITILVGVLCCIGINFDNAFAIDNWDRTSTTEIGFPFTNDTVIYGLTNSYGTVYFNDTKNVEINSVRYFNTYSNLGNRNRSLNIKADNITIDSITYIMNNYQIYSGTTGYTGYTIRHTYPVDLQSGTDYYLNLFFDINFVSSNLNDNFRFGYGTGYNSDYANTNGGQSIDLSYYQDYVTNNAYVIDGICFLSIPFRPTALCDVFIIWQQYVDFTFGFNIANKPLFYYSNLNSLYERGNGSSNQVIINQMDYWEGVNYYWLYNKYNMSTNLSINDIDYYMTSSSYIDSSWVFNFVSPNNSSITATLTISLNRLVLDCAVSISSYEISFSYFGNTDSYNIGFSNGYSSAISDYENDIIESYNNGRSIGYSEGLSVAENGSFYSLLSSVIEAPLNAVLNMFDFEILGYNMKTFYLSLISLALVLFIIKMILGRVGGNSD